MALDDGDAGGLRTRFVVGRPVDGTPLQEPETYAATLDNSGRTRSSEILAGAGVQDADAVELRNRACNRLAVMHVISDADGTDTGARQRFGTSLGIGEKALVAVGMV